MYMHASHFHSVHSHYNAHLPNKNILTFCLDICIARSIKIPRETRADTYKRVITDLESHDKAKVVVLFVSEDNCRRLLAASMEKNATSKFYWLASDNWGAKRAPVRNQEWAAEGTVTVLPQRTPMPGRF